MDEAVRQIVAALRASGELANTYVIFTSDNGFFHGEHRVQRQGPGVRAVIRVPLLIRGPGIRGGRTTREMAVNPDLAATVLDVTGAKPTRSVDGRSLIPFAEEPRGEPAGPVLHEIFRQGAGGNLKQDGTRRPTPPDPARVPSYRAVRTSRWLWVEYSDGAGDFDLVRDPQQLRSRHARPALPPHPGGAAQGAQTPGEVQGEVVPQAGGAESPGRRGARSRRPAAPPARPAAATR